MSRLTYPTAIFHHRNVATVLYTSDHHKHRPSLPSRASLSDHPTIGRRKAICKLLASSSLVSSLIIGFISPGAAQGEKQQQMKWGTRSFLWEHFFEPGLSPEDSAARIKNTAEGFHALRHMVDTMSWRYLIFYIRLKSAYLKQDMKAALSTVSTGQRTDYINTANELIDNMAEFDYYVRTPKVYESYVYYEKTLKSLDNLVAFLA